MKKIKPPELPAKVALGPRPRLVKLVVKNFRCIGANPVTIELDDIVVLVGPNNAGKSSLLKAYELIMSEGSKSGELMIEDFPSGKVDPKSPPEIELHTVVYDNSPGSEWISKTETGENLVKERWTWPGPGKPARRGFNVALNRWATEGDKEFVPWGAAPVANSRRPQAHRVDAFASPDEQAKEIVNLLMAAIRERVKAQQSGTKIEKQSDYAALLAGVASLQTKIVQESREQIEAVQKELSGYIDRVFPGNCIEFDARAEDDLERAISLFKSDAQLLMGPRGGYLSTVERQGSGARRTLLWTAIRLIADSNAKKKDDGAQRPHLLLIDEPEICLHPSAVREACDLLYSLPNATKNWQVMVTTHSPCFVDFARDHTSIVRVERNAKGDVSGTTIFRPGKAHFDGDDKERLKLLNICDPYVAEFFFGGKTLVVEGDTEYTAFQCVIAANPRKYDGVHIVRARGKATIVSLCKILNQFGTPYSILHDSDRMTCVRKEKVVAHPSWKLNISIRDEASRSAAKILVAASVPNFEEAYFGEEAEESKPYNAFEKLKSNQALFNCLAQLLDGLLEIDRPLPNGAIAWAKIGDLEAALAAFELAKKAAN